MRYYKFLTKDRKTPFAKMQAPPVGEWWPKVNGEPIKCKNGYHFCNESELYNLINWTLAEIEVENGAKIVDFDGELVTCGRIRILREAQVDLVGYAMACAERARGYATTFAATAFTTAAAYAANDAATYAYAAFAAADAASDATTYAYAANDAANAANTANAAQRAANAANAAQRAALAAGPDAYANERKLQSNWLIANCFGE
jgi:hypothetical protein